MLAPPGPLRSSSSPQVSSCPDPQFSPSPTVPSVPACPPAGACWDIPHIFPEVPHFLSPDPSPAHVLIRPHPRQLSLQPKSEYGIPPPPRCRAEILGWGKGFSPTAHPHLQFGKLLCLVAGIFSIDQLCQQKFLELRPLGAPSVERRKGLR